MESLPLDVLLIIFRLLPPRQQVRLRILCKAFARRLPRHPQPPLRNPVGYAWPFKRKWRQLAFLYSSFNAERYLSTTALR